MQESTVNRRQTALSKYAPLAWIGGLTLISCYLIITRL